MAGKSIGFIETFGLAAAITAADAAVKTANVKLLGYEYTKGGGLCTVKVEGDVAACQAAVAAGKKAADAVNGTKSILVIPRPAEGVKDKLIYIRENVGGDIALAEGYRPKGESRMPVLVKDWKPKEEPKVEEAPMEEAPEPPVVEALEEETPEPEKKTEIVESEPEVQPEITESVEAPEAEITESVEAPEAEETAPVEAPEEESAPVEAPEEAPVVGESVPAEETEKVEKSEKQEAPKKTTSTGNRRSGRSRKKKNTDK